MPGDRFKPLLILPPAPARWAALQELLGDEPTAQMQDLQRRVTEGVPGGQDACAVIPAGGHVLAAAFVRKSGDLGLLGPVRTHAEHRGRQYARRVLSTALAWFDMTGGRWLLATAADSIGEPLGRKFGFAPLRSGGGRATLLRTAPGSRSDPLAGVTGDLTVRELTPADVPAMVALLQFRAGPDTRLPLEDSATAAEAFTLELFAQQARGIVGLLGAVRGAHLVGVASLALDAPGQRTYAMILPHVDAPGELRDAVRKLAGDKGYPHVEFPMESLAPHPATAPPPELVPALPAQTIEIPAPPGLIAADATGADALRDQAAAPVSPPEVIPLEPPNMPGAPDLGIED